MIAPDAFTTTPREELVALAESYVRALATDGLMRSLLPLACPFCPPGRSASSIPMPWGQETAFVGVGEHAWAKHVRSALHRGFELAAVQIARGLVVLNGSVGWSTRARNAGIPIERFDNAHPTLSPMRWWVTRAAADEIASTCMSKHEAQPAVDEHWTGKANALAHRIPPEVRAWAIAGVHMSGPNAGTWKPCVRDMDRDFVVLRAAFARVTELRKKGSSRW